MGGTEQGEVGDLTTLDRRMEDTSQQEVFSREVTSTEQRILTAFLYHAGLSYRWIEPFMDQSYKAIGQWFHRLGHLFGPDCQVRNEVAVDETKIEIDSTLRLSGS